MPKNKPNSNRSLRNKHRVNNNDLYDLASLTKVVATTSAIMKLYDQGRIHLNDKVIRYLPEFRGPTKKQTRIKSTITIRDLLAHVSGLPAGNDVHDWHDVFQTSLVEYPRHYEIYSDINFLLLGKIIEKISGIPLDQFDQKYIFSVLGMTQTQFNPPLTLSSGIVPTQNHIQGNVLVNDPLSHHFGGVTGNAGLFSSITDLNKFASIMLAGGEYHGKRIFKSSTVSLFTRRANILPNSTRALGWDTVYNPRSELDFEHDAPHQFTAGRYIDSNAFGHTGFTGTSIWISKKYGLYVILLTNRVLPFAHNVGNVSEKYWRQRINSYVWHKLGFKKENLLFEEPKV